MSDLIAITHCGDCMKRMTVALPARPVNYCRSCRAFHAARAFVGTLFFMAASVLIFRIFA